MPRAWAIPAFDGIRRHRHLVVAGISAAAILFHFALRRGTGPATGASLVPLYAGLVVGGAPSLYGIFDRFCRGSFAPPLVEGAVLASSVLLGWYLAATFLVALSGGIGWLRGGGGAALARLVGPASSLGGRRLQSRRGMLSKCWPGPIHGGSRRPRKRSIPR